MHSMDKVKELLSQHDQQNECISMQEKLTK